MLKNGIGVIFVRPRFVTSVALQQISGNERGKQSDGYELSFRKLRP